MNKQSIILFFILQVIVAHAQVLNTHLITIDTTWSSDTVKIYQDIVISNGATLQIDPGVYVEFQGNFSLDVYGKILGFGNPNDSIVFSVIDHTAIDDTSSLQGGWGGIRLFTNSSDTSSFRYCRFSYGKAVVPSETWDNPNNENNKGGAVYLNGYAHLVISNSTFYHNRANYSGGGINIQNCISIKLLNNTFKYNIVYSDGGGGFIKSCNHSLVSENLFVWNEAFAHLPNNYIAGSGGGLSLHSNSTVVNNRFFNNNSVSGTLYFSTFRSFIYNNLIANNMGPGLLVDVWYNGNTKLINNTIVNNLGYDPVGGIYFFSKRVIMRNNIVYGNEFFQTWHEPIQVFNPYPNGDKADFAYSCNPDEPIYYEGEGNITSDPLFVNPTAGAGPEYDGLSADWSLQSNSPCINSGTPDTTGLLLPELDLADNPRIFGNRIDMGAYENQHVWVKINDSPAFADQIKVYPNPGTNRIMVQLSENTQEAWIELLDGTGQRVLLESVYSNLCLFTPTHLPSGIYFYRIYNRDQVFKKGKWVKL